MRGCFKEARVKKMTYRKQQLRRKGEEEGVKAEEEETKTDCTTQVLVNQKKRVDKYRGEGRGGSGLSTIKALVYLGGGDKSRKTT